MKLPYMCLDSALDLWPPCHFEFGFFLLGSGVTKWSMQPFPSLRSSKSRNG